MMKNINTGCSASLLSGDSLVPCFQPLINIRTGRCCGAEVLARVRQPDGGLLSHAQFFTPDTTEAAFSALTRTMMMSVSEAFREYKLPHRFMLMFNIIPATITESWLLSACHQLSCSGGNNVDVILELTEQRPLCGDIAEFRRSIHQLRESGIKLALDDFGTGHAGHALLMHAGGDFIKIPMIFVREMDTNPRALNIIKNIVHLAGSLDMHVIAEGVYSPERVAQLSSLGVSLFQGRFFSMPLDDTQFKQFLRTETADSIAQLKSYCTAPHHLPGELLQQSAKRFGLTARETDVMIAVVQGRCADKKSGMNSHVSPKTFSAQKRSAYRKMGVSSDVELLHYLYNTRDVGFA
ncbi:EAL domain-containing protein [Salmonella enterica subsp. enterica]|nr:EAL domain-containing protein [Salmonella enterica subsp. enterica serovar Javiana]EEK7952613.1 EAL domain-containing protein [Salmonella enterica subsp. enterica serovar Javiana]EEK7979326.1 EAL domain-containing protein [Salmonella enterica subsp. enterica serovar Javiana]EEK8040073.1 EAL domain-containing protein [Salmonella enterica subsp. enterica serovar Javiana]EEK8073119.1 EAL domain-containing protein [Salmonella enterica subsp. enterica serovar Javiana]